MSVSRPAESSESVADEEAESGSVGIEYTSEDADERGGPVAVDHSPPRLAQFLSIAAAVAGAAITAPFAILAIPFGIAGVASVAGSLALTHSRSWLTFGTGLVLVGAITTGAYGGIPAELMLIGVGATLFAWDVGQHGIVIGNQLGRATLSRRMQLVHASTSAVAIGLISALGYVVYLFAGSGRHVAAVAVTALGVVILAWMYRS